MDRPVEPLVLDYATRDWEIVDYQFYELPDAPQIQVRGPAIDLGNKYFTCLGAAQTLGVYVERPFPNLLADALGMPVLNLATGAASPAFYADNDSLIQHVNRGRFLILQVMSARGESSSRFEATGTIESLRDRQSGESKTSVEAYRQVLLAGPTVAEQYVGELRASWVRNSLRLLEKIEVPVILFWFSRRPQDERLDYTYAGTDDVFKRMGEFPHFVDSRGVGKVAARCHGFVECLSSRNAGHLLRSRFTGKPASVDHGALGRGSNERFSVGTAVNAYYPSPEMHEDAADALLERVDGLRTA